MLDACRNGAVLGQIAVTLQSTDKSDTHLGVYFRGLPETFVRPAPFFVADRGDTRRKGKAYAAAGGFGRDDAADLRHQGGIMRGPEADIVRENRAATYSADPVNAVLAVNKRDFMRGRAYYDVLGRSINAAHAAGVLPDADPSLLLPLNTDPIPYEATCASVKWLAALPS